MPIYEYECKNCQTRFEKLQSITSEPLTVCENCGGGPIRRVLHPVGIIFKGSGWYVNDSRKSSSSGGSSGGSSDGSSEAKSDSKGGSETAPKKNESSPAGSSSGTDSSASGGD